MTKPNEREKAKNRREKRTAVGIEIFLLLVFSRFSLLSRTQRMINYRVFFLFLSHRRLFLLPHTPFALIFYRSTKKPTLISRYNMSLWTTRKLRKAIRVAYTTSGFFDLHTHVVVYVHTFSDYVLFFRFLSFLSFFLLLESMCSS